MKSGYPKYLILDKQIKNLNAYYNNQVYTHSKGNGATAWSKLKGSDEAIKFM